MTARYRHSMRRHFERQHKSLSDDWDKPGFVNDLIEKSLPALLVDQDMPKDQDNAVIKVACDADVEFEPRKISEGLVLSVTGLDRDRFVDQTEFPVQHIVGQIGQSELNGELRTFSSLYTKFRRK